ncbi:GDSL-type esterase/lipase family protein [Ancylobacter sp. TS-1]|uniref:DUF459 domain-containing protein n=1 Tax=Ancylobacter sp. TS-1 TaxID=1850374 RepID=UPI001265CD7F|nr:GDSL-type esterase/lipase family protein [Ancylobacter sp. TS-1]QFR33105.1 DUF459 domain-containing protein [Ancylobacter sp. TS-1]
MRARGFRLGLKTLAVAGVLVAGCSLAQAQSDWFRPPADIGQSSGRNSVQRQQAPSRQQAQQPRQNSRQQQARPSAQQPAREAQPRRAWSPFQPLIDLFSGGSRARQVPQAPPPPVVAQQPAEPRGKVFASTAEARADTPDLKEIVLVLGDEQAGPLAQGLADAFAADREGAVVVGRSEDGSGFAPGNRFDWIATARQFPVGSDQPNVIVVFAGGNDLKPIEDPAGRAELLDDRWRDIYGRRFQEFLLALKMQGRPVVVVGLPPAEDDVRNAQIVRLNELLKEQVERAGLIFVDVTDGFVDENGKFMMSGPAVDGQRRRLRTSDGIGFTRAGARKLAFFVDRELDDLMVRKDTPAAEAPDPADARPSIVNLTGGPVGNARALAGGPGATPATPASIVQAATPDSAVPEPASVLVSGTTLPPVAGRTDDFRWPAGQPAATTDPLVPPMPPSVLPPVVAPLSGAAGTGTGTGTAAP